MLHRVPKSSPRPGPNPSERSLTFIHYLTRQLVAAECYYSPAIRNCRKPFCRGAKWGGVAAQPAWPQRLALLIFIAGGPSLRLSEAWLEVSFAWFKKSVVYYLNHTGTECAYRMIHPTNELKTINRCIPDMMDILNHKTLIMNIIFK